MSYVRKDNVGLIQTSDESDLNKVFFFLLFYTMLSIKEMYKAIPTKEKF